MTVEQKIVLLKHVDDIQFILNVIFGSSLVVCLMILIILFYKK